MSFRPLWLMVTACVAATGCADESTSLLVQLPALGQLQGRLDTTRSGLRQFVSFQAVPYAQPPVDQLRFERSRPVEPWTGVLDATRPAPPCAQYFLGQFLGAEDCLYLNVYTPALPTSEQEEGRAVMVFIPGGAFNFGSSGPEENGPGLLLDEDVVLVTFNYRVGPFGFLTTDDAVAPGNYGLYDQLEALRWVRVNIAAFGGDPGRVTLFGESAGGVSVHLHMVSPLSRGLFQRAISQSATAMSWWTTQRRQRQLAEQLAAAVGCGGAAAGDGDSAQLVACLRQTPARQLAEAQDPVFRHWSVYPLMFAFHPRVEVEDRGVEGGRFLPQEPRALIESGRFSDVPWIVGFNRDEGGTFGSIHLVNATALELLRSDPHRYGPIWLGLTEDRADDPGAVYDRVKQFYFGRQQPGLSSIDAFVRAEGDRFFATAVDAAVRLHVRHGSAPVYKYVMEQIPSVPYPSIISSMFKNTELPSYPWGLGHKGELRYLFSGQEFPESEVDDQFARVLVNVWTNFARTGRPHTRRISFPEWLPYSEKTDNHMRLSQAASMASGAYNDRMAFWQGLPLKEGGNLGYRVWSGDDQGSCPIDGCPDQ